MSQVVGGEAVAVDLRVATVASRLLAALIDLVIQVVLLLVLFAALTPVLNRADDALTTALALAAFVLVGVGYPVLMETFWRGRTIGKVALGLRVVRDDGGPVRFRHALVRGLMAAIVEKPGFSAGLVALVTAAVHVRSKRLGDVLAGTLVVQERVPGVTSAPLPMPPALAAWAAMLDLSGLRDDLAMSTRRFLARAGELSPQAREQLGRELVAEVAAVVSPPPPQGTPGWMYLTAVLAERRRREELRIRHARAVHPAGRGTVPRRPTDGVPPVPSTAAGDGLAGPAPAAAGAPAAGPTPAAGGAPAPEKAPTPGTNAVPDGFAPPG